MKTSISSEALTQFGVEKIAFAPKPDIRTDRRTDGRTDGRTVTINYRVVSLLKMCFNVLSLYNKGVYVPWKQKIVVFRSFSVIFRIFKRGSFLLLSLYLSIKNNAATPFSP